MMLPWSGGWTSPVRRSRTALVLYYFIGIDEGATSVFGNSLVIHEFVHDAPMIC
jgi:hypothetical protein